MKALTNLFCYQEKELIHMNIRTAGKDLIKYYCLIKKLFTRYYVLHITVVDYRHAKRVFKNFSNTKFGFYHDLHVQIITCRCI